jgi:thymidine kinase
MPPIPELRLRSALLLHVITGPMWSGKSRRLIEVVEAKRAAYERVLVVQHAASAAASAAPRFLSSRAGGARLPVDLRVDDLDAVLPCGACGDDSEPATLVAVDEAQFFRANALLRLFSRVSQARPPLRRHGLVVAGLDRDFRRAPFGGALALARAGLGLAGAAGALPVAGSVVVERLAARCDRADGGARCGAPASCSQRLSRGGSATVVVGSDAYAPACELHHSPEPAPAEEWGR